MLQRRSLLRWVFAGSAGMALPLTSLGAEETPEAPGEGEEWLDAIGDRKFRAFLDIRSFSPVGNGYRKAATLLSALTKNHGAASAEVGIAFGAGSDGLAHVVGPAFWEEYRIGERLALTGRPEDAAALRADPRKWGEVTGAGVREMRASGVRVLACKNTMARWSRELAEQSKETPEVVLAKLNKGLHEGVEPVPAMVAAAVLAQLRGLSYVAIG